MPENLQDVPSAGNPFRYFWRRGYLRLCSICPPGAATNPTSGLGKIVTRALAKGKGDPRGKAPARLWGDGLWTGYDWLGFRPTEQTLDQWHSWGASVGILTGQGIVAVDADVTDPEAAARVEEIIRDVLGVSAPKRVGRAPKFLLLFRITDDVPYSAVQFRTATEDRARVEVLYEGRQFVAHGVHPGTGQPYAWEGGRGVPDREELPLIRPDQVEEILARIAAEFEGAEVMAGGTRAAPKDQSSLRGRPELVASAVNSLPNRDRDFPDRQTFIGVGYAIKAAFGPSYEDEALDCYQQWAARWDEGYNDPEEVEDEWRRMQPPFRAGARLLFEWAEKLGGWEKRGLHDFEPMSVAEAERLVRQAEVGIPVSEAAAEKPTQPVYELLSIDDLLNLPDPEWLLERHLPQTGMGFLYGRPGCGKSFLALDMALHIAYGLPRWHGDEVRARPGANVLYIAREGATGFKQRIIAWQAARQLPVGRAANFRLLRETINFMSVEDIAKLARTVRAAGMRPLDLVIVDTVSRSIPGADENNQADMSIFVQANDAIVAEFDCVALGVHHAGKSGDMRGSTVLRGAGDFVFRLARDEGAQYASLHCEKQKEGPDGWSERYRFSEIAGSLVPARVPKGDDISDMESAAAKKLEAVILAAVEEAWTAGDPLADGKREVNNPRHILNELRRRGALGGHPAEAVLAFVERLIPGKIKRDQLPPSRGRKRGLRVSFLSNDAPDAPDTSAADTFG